MSKKRLKGILLRYFSQRVSEEEAQSIALNSFGVLRKYWLKSTLDSGLVNVEKDLAELAGNLRHDLHVRTFPELVERLKTLDPFVEDPFDLDKLNKD